MRQLFYVMNDWKTHLRVNMIFVIQMFIVCLLVYYSVSLSASTHEGYRELSAVAESDTYVLADYSDMDHLAYMFANEDHYIDDIRDLYESIISSNDFYTYTCYSYIDTGTKDGIYIKQYTADANFLEINAIRVGSGVGFSEEGFETGDEGVVPILVGYKIRDVYKLGEVYTLYDGGTGEALTCKVVGVLENNAGYYDLNNLSEYVNLNYSYIKPLMYGNVEDMSYSDIDMAISSTVFFAEDKNDVEAVAQKSAELGLFTYSVESLATELDAMVSDMKEELAYMLGVATIILLFASVGMTANLNMMITQNMREYTIHILCGGRYLDIACRLTLQLFISAMIALIPAILIIGIGKSAVYTIMIILSLMGIVMIFPLRKLYAIPVAELLKRAE